MPFLIKRALNLFVLLVIAGVERTSFPNQTFIELNSMMKSTASQFCIWFLMNLSKPLMSLSFEKPVIIPVFDKSIFAIIKFPLGSIKNLGYFLLLIFIFIHRNDIYLYINKIRFNLIRFGSSFLGFLLLGLLHDK